MVARNPQDYPWSVESENLPWDKPSGFSGGGERGRRKASNQLGRRQTAVVAERQDLSMSFCRFTNAPRDSLPDAGCAWKNTDSFVGGISAEGS